MNFITNNILIMNFITISFKFIKQKIWKQKLILFNINFLLKISCKAINK